jgi:hypothetical protein
MTRISIPLGLIACLVATGTKADPITITLTGIDSGLTSPSGNYRWLDAADQAYNAAYRNSYNYTQAKVNITYDTPGPDLRGVLLATNLKPNFVYQLKLAATPGTPTNDRIGMAGRWWQEEWNGTAWVNGQNLNDKGTGYSPTPNDTAYVARRDMADATSPTGKHYRYTGYLVFDYFLTDSQGNATVSFQANSSYHVLWKTTQRAREARDGPLKNQTFTPSQSQRAYDVNYPQTTVSIFGEWERLPVGGIHLALGQYDCQIILTEESFHGGGQYAGGWAAAMGSNISFEAVAANRPRLTGAAVSNGRITFAIEDCPLGLTNQVERSFNLQQTNGWSGVFSFVSTTASTNWSDTINTNASTVFYRVKSQ